MGPSHAAELCLRAPQAMWEESRLPPSTIAAPHCRGDEPLFARPRSAYVPAFRNSPESKDNMHERRTSRGGADTRGRRADGGLVHRARRSEEPAVTRSVSGNHALTHASRGNPDDAIG
ncbi:hypothetical protein AAFF_G00433960 [Aldrovandia affinis]|uniref:Uncharacterized protein n=1 Tax=Aldrovandia affinis TaxID=143900 RepID=A0AAD7WI16_9TELE|nr:hypothetical protein AAFF_G00433960 [Aldrovandia affinis]